MYNLQTTKRIKWDEEKQRKKKSSKRNTDKTRQIESTKLVAELNPNT